MAAEYSRNIPNLFMAGRYISVTRESLGAVRVMRTTALMGEVAGMAATRCTEHGIDPRDVYEEHLGNLKEMCGMERDVIANDGTMSGKKTPLQMTVLKPRETRQAVDTASKRHAVRRGSTGRLKEKGRRFFVQDRCARRGLKNQWRST